MNSLTLKPNILFDLDGTLLPLDMDLFEKVYFKGLWQKVNSIYPIEPKKLVDSIWKGTKAMVLNDGSCTNREAFAKVFTLESGLDYYSNEKTFLEYYETDFQKLKEVCQIQEYSLGIIDKLQALGYNVAIATNPLFPEVATYSRLRWLGIDPKRFPLVTTFENSTHAKPNPAYYQEVLDKLGIKASETMMVGNDIMEDGMASKVGIKTIFLKDCLINSKDIPTEGMTILSLKELYDYIMSL